MQWNAVISELLLWSVYGLENVELPQRWKEKFVKRMKDSESSEMSGGNGWDVTESWETRRCPWLLCEGGWWKEVKGKEDGVGSAWHLPKSPVLVPFKWSKSANVCHLLKVFRSVRCNVAHPQHRHIARYICCTVLQFIKWPFCMLIIAKSKTDYRIVFLRKICSFANWHLLWLILFQLKWCARFVVLNAAGTLTENFLVREY